MPQKTRLQIAPTDKNICNMEPALLIPSWHVKR